MDSQLDAVRARLKANAPRCLEGFLKSSVTPVLGKGDPFTTAWRISCSCGNAIGGLLGYPLSDQNPNYRGAPIFISPLAVECSACATVTELLDTKLHGYHSELAAIEGGTGSAAYRGKGNRNRYGCPKCAKGSFEFTLKFCYWDGAFDLFLDEPDRPCQDFFDLAVVAVACSTCGTASEPVSLES